MSAADVTSPAKNCPSSNTKSAVGVWLFLRTAVITSLMYQPLVLVMHIS